MAKHQERTSGNLTPERSEIEAPKLCIGDSRVLGYHHMTIQYNANTSAQSPIASPPPEEVKTKNERIGLNNDLSAQLTGDYASRSSLGYYNFNLNDYNSSRHESKVDLY